jgi:hypothetical protein
MAKQATLTSETEITYYFIRKLKESVVQQSSHVPLLMSKQLKGYVPHARHTGIATNKYRTGVDQLIEVKVIHNGCVQYGRPEVRDSQDGAAAVQYFQRQVRKQYITQMKRKGGVHFGIGADDKGPLETLFRQLDFKPMGFFTFGKMSYNVKDFIDLAVDYGAEHLGLTTETSSMDTIHQALKRRYKAQLSIVSWRGYANLILDRTKYVGDGIKALNKDQIKLRMIYRADNGELVSSTIYF